VSRVLEKLQLLKGVAQRIVADDVPDALIDKRIVILDLAAMIAGTKYRGEFEDRLKKVMQELESDDKTIVFIDEIHQLVGAGSAEGSMDAGNILKPSLARGKIQLIGATTTNEYTKHIEKDAALERRLTTCYGARINRARNTCYTAWAQKTL
jgi:ATP-dependent Clp protease ATP-binding subunit ClpC